MKHDRLHALSDGIFAIAMTLLVLELRVPELHNPSNGDLIRVLQDTWPAFFAWVLSFALLFTYWRAHNVLMSTFAKAINSTLVLINMIFLMLITIVPFTTLLLGRYNESQVAIGVYVINMFFIGLTMWIARAYIQRTPGLSAENHGWTKRDHRNALVRSLGPPFVGCIAFIVSYQNTTAAYVILVCMGLLNVFSRGFDPLFSLLDKLGVANE